MLDTRLTLRVEIADVGVLARLPNRGGTGSNVEKLLSFSLLGCEAFRPAIACYFHGLANARVL